MEYKSLLHKKLSEGAFVYTAETTPPDASDKEVLLKKIKPLGIEGQGSDGWLLIDLGDVVIHLMSSNMRRFYDLESLWDPDI